MCAYVASVVKKYHIVWSTTNVPYEMGYMYVTMHICMSMQHMIMKHWDTNTLKYEYPFVRAFLEVPLLVNSNYCIVYDHLLYLCHTEHRHTVFLSTRSTRSIVYVPLIQSQGLQRPFQPQQSVNVDKKYK